MEERDLSRDVARLEGSLGILAEPQANPYLVMLSGLPGTGKSFFCLKLRQRLPAAIVESDAVRNALFAGPTFSPRESGHVFDVCHILMERLLHRGIPVIMDATNLMERHREQVYHIAERCGTALFIVRLDASSEVVRQRLERRAQQHDSQDPSLADWAVYCRMRYAWEPIRRNHFRVDTSTDIDSAVRQVVAAVSTVSRP